ncbi:hypothetical protein [Spirosoma rhododendri]|uniref:Uncharacterized protein n=1 Tax=Spirosoma rhododendri TaxID=2728024 RepID=A0A7L5DRY5_9BACT|nr:hypothetical protein [Spirosoma rhododendri]QJD80895.1 hypothetical protein HH216_22575 [Spirosoma rhododendri]
MSLQPETYHLLIYIATLGVTLLAGLLLGTLTNGWQYNKPRPQKVTHRH